MAGDMMNTTGLSMDHGPFTSDDEKPVIDYDIGGIHMTLDYFCCYSPLELLAIDEIVKSFQWPKMTVSFDRVICTVNEDEIGEHGNGNPDSIELMILLDDESQQKLLAVNQGLEQLMRNKGLIVNVPRRDNIGFHITLAHVDQTQFPVNSMMEDINTEINFTSVTMDMFEDGPICGEYPEDKSPNIWNLTCFG